MSLEELTGWREGQSSTMLSLHKAQDQQQPQPADVKKGSVPCEEGQGTRRPLLLAQRAGKAHSEEAYHTPYWKGVVVGGAPACSSGMELESASLASCAPDWMHSEFIPPLGLLCEATTSGTESCMSFSGVDLPPPPHPKPGPRPQILRMVPHQTSGNLKQAKPRGQTAKQDMIRSLFNSSNC